METKFKNISIFFAAIDHFEQSCKRVDIIHKKGDKQEQILWRNHRHYPSLQEVLGQIWFIPDPTIFYSPFKLQSVLQSVMFEHETKILHFKVSSGTITIEENQSYLTDPEELNDLGLDYWYEGCPEEAEEYFYKALALHPALEQAWNNLGLVHLDQQDAVEAERCFRKAIECSAQYSGAWTNLGQALASQKRIEEAEQAHQTALKFDPVYAGAWQNLGNLYLLLEQWAKAMKAYHRSLQCDPYNYEVLSNLGTTFLFQQRYKEAMECYQAAYELAPPGFIPILDDLMTKARNQVPLDDFSIKVV